jgi:hypothetical protein
MQYERSSVDSELVRRYEVAPMDFETTVSEEQSNGAAQGLRYREQREKKGESFNTSFDTITLRFEQVSR